MAKSNLRKTRKPIEFGRLQWVALVVGLFHLGTAFHPLFAFDTSDPVLRVCTGVLGVVMARKWENARRFGVALVVGYGGWCCRSSLCRRLLALAKRLPETTLRQRPLLGRKQNGSFTTIHDVSRTSGRGWCHRRMLDVG